MVDIRSNPLKYLKEKASRVNPYTATPRRSSGSPPAGARELAPGLAALLTAHNTDPINAHGGVQAEVTAARGVFANLLAHLTAMWDALADHLTDFDHAAIHEQNTDTHTSNGSWGIGGTSTLLRFNAGALEQSVDSGANWTAILTGLTFAPPFADTDGTITLVLDPATLEVNDANQLTVIGGAGDGSGTNTLVDDGAYTDAGSLTTVDDGSYT